MNARTMDTSALLQVGGPAPAASSTPDSRATEFHAVEGGQEMRSGGQLVVEAYAIIWLLLLGWLVLVWRKQNALSARLGELEAAIARHDAAAVGGRPESRP
jgi:CcmD family protein